MKIIEELESLESGSLGNNGALFFSDTGLKAKDTNSTKLFDFDTTLAELGKLKCKYPNYRLFIGCKGSCGYTEFTLFGEREENQEEKEARLLSDTVKLEKQEAKKQKQIERLKKDAKKLGVEIK